MKTKKEIFEAHWAEIAYQAPTPIQAQTYKPLKEKHSVIGISPTGTGKTVAYTLPLLENIEINAGLQLVILVPSQELGMQVTEVVKEWANLLDLKVQALIGGANIKRQLDKLKEKPEIVIGTPGRIFELSELKKLKLHQVQAIVLDECDHLLQGEQLSVIRKLVEKTPKHRQLAFFSATKNQLLDELPKWFDTEVQLVDVTDEDILTKSITHAYIEGPTRKRVELLRKLSHIDDFSALVFVNNMADLDLLAEKLHYEKVPVAVMHSEKNKVERKKALDLLKNKKIKLLLTTDVASRGLDIAKLPYVVQYDLPLKKESYIHRSGRTGRMGAKGTVLTLVNDRELRTLKQMMTAIGYELSPLYLTHRQLLSERPVQEESDVTVKQTVKAKKKVAEISLPSEKMEAAPKKRKKNRLRDKKNKGKKTTTT